MRIGIDLGGTKIEGVALDAGGQERARRRIPTPRHDYPGTIAAIAALVAFLEQEAGSRATVGVGIPGTLSPLTGRVKNANSLWLNGQPFDRDLAQALGRPVRLQNDANCLAVSEAADGAAAGAKIVFAVILGTGCGAGIVVNGTVLTGRNAISGEWGHNPLPWPQPADPACGWPEDERPGPACSCGQRGCIETYLSGPGLAADYLRAISLRAIGAVPEPAAAPLPAETVVARAEAGDPAAEAALVRYEHRLARSLAGVVNILDPDVIVLGGGLSRLSRLYTHVPLLLPRWCFSDGITTPLRPALHGDASGVRGAAWLWGGIPAWTGETAVEDLSRE